MIDHREHILSRIQSDLRKTAPAAVLRAQSHYDNDDLAFVDVACVSSDERKTLRAKAITALADHSISVVLDTSRDVYNLRIT